MSGFTQFLAEASAENQPSGKSYKEFSEKVWGTGQEIASSQPLTEKDLGLEGMNPAQKFLELSKQKEAIDSLTENAKIKNDPDGIGLRNLLSSKLVASDKEPPTMTVQLPEDVIKKHGGGKAKDVVFGAKEMNSAADKDLIIKQFDTARQYLDNIELHFVQGKDGKETAIVVGADAKKFNTVITAENRKEQLGQMVEKARQEMQGQGQSQAKEPEVGQTTSPDLDMDKWKKLAASLPSRPDPDQEASIKPLHVPVNPQHQQEKEKSAGASVAA